VDAADGSALGGTDVAAVDVLAGAAGDGAEVDGVPPLQAVTRSVVRRIAPARARPSGGEACIA
jgi:hypothetical protein